MSDYESLQNEYNSYKSSHSHTNDEYNSYGLAQYASGKQAAQPSKIFDQMNNGSVSYKLTKDYSFLIITASAGKSNGDGLGCSVSLNGTYESISNNTYWLNSSSGKQGGACQEIFIKNCKSGLAIKLNCWFTGYMRVYGIE